MAKYTIENLLPMLRLFIQARNQAISMGFTDNGGAIHSVERILDILAQRIRYPELSHVNSLKKAPWAERSLGAVQCIKDGQKVLIEHVYPQRAFAREVIRLVGEGISDPELIKFIRSNYRLVLLSKEETDRLNKINRSLYNPKRLEEAGVQLAT